MDAIEIFKQLIGEKIKPMIIKYEPYKYVFTTHPYSHILDVNFEARFTDTVFDSIIFYAYEKDEIEKEYQKGHLDDLRKASRVACQPRIIRTSVLRRVFRLIHCSATVLYLYIKAFARRVLT